MYKLNMSMNNSSPKPADEIKLEAVEIKEQFFVNETGLEEQKVMDKSDRNEMNDATCKMEDIIYVYDSNDEEDVPVIKSEDVDVVEQFVNEKGINERETFLNTKEDNQTNHASCKSEKEDQEESSFHVYDSSDRENCTVIKSEYMDTTEQFVDKKGIDERETFLNTNENSQTNNASCKRKKDDQQESIIHIYDSSDEENCSDIKCEAVDTTEQFVDEKGIHDREAFLNQNQDHRTPRRSCSIMKNKSEQDTSNFNIQDRNFVDQYLSMAVRGVRERINSARNVLKNVGGCLYKECEPEGDLKHQCIDCENTGKSNSWTELFRCYICAVRTSTKCLLEKHMDEVHLKVKTYRCSLCGHKARDEINIKQHIEFVHFKPKDYRCDRCYFKASSKNDLSQHIYLTHFLKHSESTTE